MTKDNFLFSKNWFTRNQTKLLWLLNTPVIATWFRWVLRINGSRSEVGKKDIIKIEPHSISWLLKQGQKKSTVSIEIRTHNKFSKRLYYAFYPLWYLFHLWDMFWQPRLNLGFDTLLADIFSDAGGDGGARALTGAANPWTVPRSAATASTIYSTNATEYAARCHWSAEPNKYLYRSFYPFDTTSIPAGALALQSGTKFSVYVNAAGSGSSHGYSVGLILTTQASLSALVAGDWNNLVLDSPDEGASRLDITGTAKDAYNDFDANANMITWINAGSPLFLGIRMQPDIDNDFSLLVFGDDNALNVAYSNTTGTTKDPKMIINVSLASINFLKFYRRTRTPGPITGV